MNKSLVSQIRLVVIDVDGTLTDGRVILRSDGTEAKAFNVRDGMGIELAIRAGIKVIWLSGRASPVSKIRADELGVRLYQPIHDKLAFLRKYSAERAIDFRSIAYIGDDVNDIEVCTRVGLSFAVGDANNKLKEVVTCQLVSNGGYGAVREAIDKILFCD
ncbi:3-deoxy-D-manno-octulosonate 8-phosphate phosphatase KdsC [Pelotomaculum sp. FP]|uniref:KdsC family phosphatase n=1 Tax=Pelotomaculum sp. FP TaxID=261474 RepID=UPI001102A870|nr:HAD hydrolase family protein [Pelotomaculum sp. FP]TEB16177.1 3-deoxy-D-manno-octulosonate 8-phosphate phosphatase KdsC [Pelotomaculum sp. FP]